MFWTLWIFVTIFCGCDFVHSQERLPPGVAPRHYQQPPPPPHPNQHYQQQQYAQQPGMTQQQIHHQQGIQQGQPIYQQGQQVYQPAPPQQQGQPYQQSAQPVPNPPGAQVPVQHQQPSQPPVQHQPSEETVHHQPSQDSVQAQQAPNAQHGHGHDHHHGAPNQVFSLNLAEDKDHIEEHLNINLDTENMPDAELQFHYFKMHDADNNNKLDGCELIKSLIHWHEQGSQEPNGNIPEKIFTDEELMQLIDPILEHDDANGDGYIDYAEFVKAQQKNAGTPSPR